MSAETQELVSLCEQLPDAKRLEVADFARFVLAREDDAPCDDFARGDPIVLTIHGTEL